MEIRAKPLLPRKKMDKTGQSSWQPEYLCFTWSQPQKAGLQKGAMVYFPKKLLENMHCHLGESPNTIVIRETNQTTRTKGKKEKEQAMQEASKQICRSGKDCTSEGCGYLHPCRYGLGCTRAGCWHLHPEGHVGGPIFATAALANVTNVMSTTTGAALVMNVSNVRTTTVLIKHPLALVKNMSTKDRNMWIRDKAPPLRLSEGDYETWTELQIEATGNQRCFAT
jgi:hypothetical protein